MNNEVKDKINDIKETLSEISRNLLLLSGSLNKVSESIDNFSILCNTSGELVCPENFSECENNPNLCVFNYLKPEDKIEVCNTVNASDEQAIFSTDSYPYSYQKGKFSVTTNDPNPIIVGVKKGWKGTNDKLRPVV